MIFLFIGLHVPNVVVFVEKRSKAHFCELLHVFVCLYTHTKSVILGIDFSSYKGIYNIEFYAPVSAFRSRYTIGCKIHTYKYTKDLPIL